jgi:hypothetical protein
MRFGRVLGRWEIVLIRRWTQKQKAGPPHRRNHPSMKLYSRPRAFIRFSDLHFLQYNRAIMFAESFPLRRGHSALTPSKLPPAQAVLACKTLPAVLASSVLQLSSSTISRSTAPTSTPNLQQWFYRFSTQ